MVSEVPDTAIAVPDVSSASIRCEVLSCGSFVDGFRIISRFHRYFGYSFFSWKNLHGEWIASATVLSPYLAFACCSWDLFAFVVIQDALYVIFLGQDSSGERIGDIDKLTIVLYFIRCLGIQLANVVTLVSYSNDLCDVVVKLQGIERNLQRPTNLRPVAKFILWQNIVFSVMALLSACDTIAQFGGYREPVYVKFGYGVFSLFFVETVCMVSFSWVMYLSRAFASFLSCINEDIERLVVGQPLDKSKLRVQHARFYDLWQAFLQCDRIFSVSLLVSVPLNILTASPWAYFILTSDKSLFDVSADVIGFATVCAELFFLGTHGSAATAQAKKTWDVLTKLLVSQDHTPEIREQIQEFRHTCQNQDFSFSGCGFFKVGPPLIVSIASAIITYTVILYQSDNSGSSFAAAAVALNVTKA